MDLWGDIGTAAGKVFNALSDMQPATTADIKRRSKLEDNMLYLAIGWLTREDKVAVEQTGKIISVKLK